MTKDELAALSASTPSLVAQYTKDGTLPAHFYHRDGGAGGRIDYALVSLAVLRIMEKLSAACGNNSPLPKLVVRQVASQIEQRWHDPKRREPICATVEGVEVTIQTSVVDEARELASVLA